MQCRHAREGHAQRCEVLGVHQAVGHAGGRQDHVLVDDHRVAVDGGDVAPADVPPRLGIRRHLPFEVHLDLRLATGHPLEFGQTASHRSLREPPPAEVDVFRAGPEFAPEDHVVDRQVQAVRHQVDRVGKDGAALLEQGGDLGIVHRSPVPDVLPCLDRVMAGDVDGLQDGDVLDISHAGRGDDAQDLGQAGVHPGSVEGGPTTLAGGFDQVGRFTARRMGVVEIAVVPGNPVGRGHDVDAVLEQGAEQIDVRPHAVEVHDVGLGVEHVFEIAGGDHPERLHADYFAGVTADLLG